MASHNSTSYSQKYDSVVYHHSMFLKKLSHPHHGSLHDPKHKESWREKLGEFLESKPENIFIFVLIILDLLIICAQLFIVEPYTKCHNEHFSQIVYMHSESAEDHRMEIADDVLDIISLVILCTLGFEIVLLLIAFDVEFFKQPLYILDGAVIAASLFIEIKERQGKESELNAGSLLIFFRLWRIVRIVHGVAMSVQEQNEDKIKELEEEVHKLQEEKQKLETKFDYIKKRYKKLVDVTKDLDTSSEPNQDSTSTDRKLRIDDAYEPTPSFVAIASRIGGPSMKSPASPKNLSHHTIRINDNDVANNDDIDINDAEISVDDVRKPLLNPPASSSKNT